MEYIRVKEDGFFYGDGRIRLRGFGIGTWLNLEHFMIGIPTPDEMIQDAVENVYGHKNAVRFFERYRDVFLTSGDFELLKECGVNFIRVPFNYRLFLDDNNPDTIKKEGFIYLDNLLSLCERYQIFALLDLHTTPGGQNPDWHSDNSLGVPLFWKYKVFRTQMADLWGTIAQRYCDEPYLMGYDLLNEPAMADWDQLNAYYEETIHSIRKVDKNHVIVLEGDGFSMEFSGLRKFEDGNLAISFHYYPTVWNPELLDPKLDREERRAKIATGLDRLLEERNRFSCPVFCGEFGYGKDCGDPEFVKGLLQDTVELMEDRKADWLLWCYKDAHFMSLVYPKETSGWMELVRKTETYWSQDIEKEQAGKLLNLIKKEWFQKMTQKERYLLQFRLRACFYMLQEKYINESLFSDISGSGLLMMAYDFAYTECETNTGMYEYIKEVLGNGPQYGV